MKKVLGCIRRADQDFHLIAPGDKIAVGVSGGKDSLLLLQALSLYKRFSKTPYELHAITLTMGLEPFDTSGVAALCDALSIPYTVIPTRIGPIIFEERQEKNPCSLCATMRRGILYEKAVALGCNKVALGHHQDDVIETFFLSLFHEGRLNTFTPVTYLSRSGLTLIRPMVYLPEQHIQSVCRKLDLPVIHNPCPANGNTQRQTVKDYLLNLEGTFPDARKFVAGAIANTPQYNLWDGIREGRIPGMDEA